MDFFTSMPQKLAGISEQDVSDHRLKECYKLTLLDLMQKEQTPKASYGALAPSFKVYTTYIHKYFYVPFAVRN